MSRARHTRSLRNHLCLCLGTFAPTIRQFGGKPSRPVLLAVLTLAVVAGVGSLLSSPVLRRVGAQGPAAQQSDVQPQGTPSGCACSDDKEDDKPHLLAASYYSLNGGLTATLMLNNKGPKPLTVQPTLFSSSGERMEVASVTVEGNSYREIDLKEYGVEGTPFQEGSIQVFHRGKDLVLGAQIKMVDAARSLTFEEKFVELATEFTSTRLEGVWWVPSRATRLTLVLSNTTDSPLPVTAAIQGVAPRPGEPMTLTLQPHETRSLELRSLNGAARSLSEAGGVSVEHAGAAGSLLARLFIQEAETGYSSWARFTDPEKTKSSKLHGAGLRLGSVGGESLAPVFVARNVGTRDSVLTGRIPYAESNGSTGVVELPEVSLRPGEARVVNGAALARLRGLGSKAATAGVEFEYSTEPGSVIMSALSVSGSRNHVFNVPLWDIEAQRSSTGGYPWSLEGGNSTVVYIKNVTARTQKYALELKSEGGEHPYVLGVKTVEAGQTVALDVRKIRDEQIPDERGRPMPPGATRGQIHWSARSADHLPLIGRVEQFDEARGLSSSYACQNCCGDTFGGGWMLPSPEAFFLGDSFQFAAQEQYTSCYNQVFINNVYGGVWTSGNWGAMSVDGNGFATAVGWGATFIRVSWPYYSFSASGDPYTFQCYSDSGETSAEAPTTNVRLRIIVPNPPVPAEVSDEFAGIVAGESVSLVLQLLREDGSVFTGNATVRTQPSRELAPTESGLPTEISITGGQATPVLRLDRVNGIERGTTYRFRLTTGSTFQDFSFLTFFRVVSSREGLVGHTTACGHVITANDHFVALPVRGLCNQRLQVRSADSFRLDVTVKRDVGPHFGGPSRCDPSGQTEDAYWNTGLRPLAERVDCEAGNNNAAIDLADGTYATLGNPAQVIWRWD